MYIYILLKIKWTFWALPDSIKLHENQAENLSWNLVPRPISILCSPGDSCDIFLLTTSYFSSKWDQHVIWGHGTEWYSYFFLVWRRCDFRRLCIILHKISNIILLNSTVQSTHHHWPVATSSINCHYDDVIMSVIASQITSLAIVYSTDYSDTDQRKHQSFASLVFVRGIHRDRWIPHTKTSNTENISIWWRHHDLASF